ncbi:cadmium/zinc-transporting ATPase HMA3 [Populus alba]|uniref:Cadmium/zinc-transporting ATPase HMA3-like isoform X2 n=1 Tax=Populus alba TaxID=43335 RepID=A0A4U5PQ37_POPAL|nr:cadmium/zinc-transporting ATPase HMA3-like [Populus alba]TKR97744.1 cadmium/zinc-transporting ATPase HMA3-like isoform X2 [Populus alba]
MAAELEKSNKAATKKLQKSYFDVLGLCCSSEVPLIENILKSLDGVKEFSVIVPTRTVIVFHDDLLISQLQIVKALNQARLEANIRAYGETKHQKKWPSPYAAACGVLLLLSLLKYVYHPLRWFAIGAVAVGILPICLKSVASLRNFRLDTNVLMLIAVIGTIAMDDYIEAGTIVFLFTIAEWLESRASHKANAVMSLLMSIAPQKAVIAETGEEVDADEVKLNTVLAVKAGEVIPIDGVVVDGNCEVDEKTLTGESFPVPKQVDSTVWAGTINLNGYMSVRTTALAEDCVVAKMAKLVEEAQNSKSKTQRFIDKFAQYYTPAVIIISASLAVVPLALRLHDHNRWFRLALVVLVSACPCALILSTPVATFCALTKAASAGLLIKGGDYLETLGKIKAMAFDKTGTLTRGEFVVTDFQPLCSDISIDTLLYWVSSIESKSSHPMAAALVDYGKMHSIEPQPEKVEEFQNFPGEGIQGKIEGKDIYIGNRKIAHRASGTVPTIEGDKKAGKSVGYVYYGATLAGIFSLSDTCRTGVAEAIKELKSLGIKTAMLTGDSEAAAMYAHEQLEHALEVVHAELLPEDKATIIKELKKEGPTAMIGDGVNDAPALATADIGISMGISGSALATETGHVILMSNDLRKVPKAIRLGRKAHRKVIENVIMSMTTKSAILALAFAGHPLVWAAVLADVGTCLLVILNSMLLLRGTHAGKCSKSSGASHSHKHGIKNSSHNHHNCCSSQNVKKVECGAQKCCSSPKVEQVQSGALNSTCASGCCSSPKVEKVHSGAQNSSGASGCCSSQKVEKVQLAAQNSNCASGCCSSQKAEVKLVAQNPSCDSGCCSGPKVEKVQTEDQNSNCASRCCSSQKVVKEHCVAQSSSLASGCQSSQHSVSSRRNQECADSAKSHDACAAPNASGVHEAKHHDHSCFNTVNPNTEANHPRSHDCSTPPKLKHPCHNSVETQGKCSDGDGLHKEKHCHHSHGEPAATHHGIHHHSGHSSHDLEGSQKTTDNTTNCCSKSSCKNTIDIPKNEESLGEIVESSCSPQHQHQELHQELKKCCTGCAPPHTVIDIEPTTMHACMSMEKREIGGCCKSYMKECCSKHGHFATGFGGGLSEITIKQV